MTEGRAVATARRVQPQARRVRAARGGSDATLLVVLTTLATVIAVYDLILLATGLS